MRKLKSLLPGKYHDGLLIWCKDCLANINHTMLIISQIPSFGKFIDDLRIIVSFRQMLHEKNISSDIANKILSHAGIYFNIGDSAILMKKYIFPERKSYDYEFKYSVKYRCTRCNHPCDYLDIQIRRGDEESDLILFCGNCGLRQKRH